MHYCYKNIIIIQSLLFKDYIIDQQRKILNNKKTKKMDTYDR